MNDVTNRFIELYHFLLNENNLKDQKDFASKIGVSGSMITEIVKGRSNVGVKAIQNTVLSFGVNSDWLFTGKGEMLLGRNEEGAYGQRPACISCRYLKDVERYQEDIARYKEDIHELRQELRTLRQQQEPSRKRRTA